MQEVKKIGLIGCSGFSPYSVILPAAGAGFAITAVASRNPAKAADFAAKYKIPGLYATYEELLEKSNVDAVYISLPVFLHAQYIIKALEAGKAVLVEKPLCTTLKDLEAIKETLHKYKGLLLEGVMMQHHPWQNALKQLIGSQQYGALESISTTLNYPAKNLDASNYRCFPELGGGAFFDLSVYWLQFIQHLLGLDVIKAYGSSGFNGPNGTDWDFSSELVFAGNVTTGFNCALGQAYCADHLLKTSKAEITLRSFDRATLGRFKITIHIKEQDSGKEEQLSFEPQNYYENQLAFFYRVLTGQCDNLPFAQSEERTRLMLSIFAGARKEKLA